VQDVNGDGTPDLLVSSPQSDNVFQIDGVGRGLFDDQSPVVFNTGPGSAPVQALVGQFDGNPGLDLITLDSGSNSLTLFSGFGPGPPGAHATGLAGSGGERPVAALAGDFNRDGLSDPIVANNDDGHVALLLGTEEGPALARVFSAEGLAHPTDLALSGDGTELYVSGEGEEAVARFTLDFGTAVPVPVAQGGGGGEPGSVSAGRGAGSPAGGRAAVAGVLRSDGGDLPDGGPRRGHAGRRQRRGRRARSRLQRHNPGGPGRGRPGLAGAGRGRRSRAGGRGGEP